MDVSLVERTKFWKKELPVSLENGYWKLCTWWHPLWHPWMRWLMSVSLAIPEELERQSRSALGGSGQGTIWVNRLWKLLSWCVEAHSQVAVKVQAWSQPKTGARRLPLKTHLQLLQLGHQMKRNLQWRELGYPSAGSHTDRSQKEH